MIGTSMTAETAGAADDRRRASVLSAMWIFAMFNYLYADVMTLMQAEVLQGFLAGQVGGMRITPAFLLAAAVLMETAIAMTLLSRILARKPNRILNIVAGILHTAAVGGSLFAGTGEVAPFYLFCAVIEMACTVFIVGYAWTWKARSPELAAAV